VVEGQKLQNALVDRWVKPQATLVGTDGAVHFHPVSPVDPHLVGVIQPGDAKGDDAFGLDDAFGNTVMAVFGGFIQDRFDAGHHVSDGLEKFFFMGISGLES
jgi:hypothetical protein